VVARAARHRSRSRDHQRLHPHALLLAFEEKGAPGTQPPGLYPWYEVPGHAPRDLNIACGHWSTLGLHIGNGVHALDTGAVWGGKLTALQLDADGLHLVQVPGRDVAPP
jgi:bis(5'-nucleosyl)-tetraphosphatase (symmetrical)